LIVREILLYRSIEERVVLVADEGLQLHGSNTKKARF
jgi:hypothetical protein